MSYGPWQETQLDPSEHAVARYLDAFGRLRRTEETDDQGRLVATQYGYNTRGERVSMTDPAGNAWSWTFDSTGRLLSRNDPDAGHWTYAYDVALRKTTQTDAKGQIVETLTDGVGRVTQKISYGASGSTTTFTYGEARSGYFNAGRLTTMTDAQGSARYDYDALGRQVRQVRTLDGVEYVLQRRYGTAGQLNGTTFPDGDTFGTPASPMLYDAAGRLKSVPGIVTDAQYDALGRPVQRSNANGTETIWQYHDRGWVRHITTEGTAGLLQDLDYAADDAGRTTTLTSPFPNEAWQYGYDALGRLTSATSLWDPAQSQSFQYDLVGNKIYDSRIGTIGYPATGSPRPHAPSDVAGQAMQYDLNGNLVSGRSRTYVWNVENKPTLVNGVSFVYAGDGARLKKSTATSTTVYPLGDDYEVKDGIATKYLRLGALAARRVNGVTYWLHTDRLGSVQAVSNALGQDVLRRTYRPYGQKIGDSTSHWEPLGYIGERLDGETGLTYLHARYYDSELGVFVSPDPLDPGEQRVGFNRYAYSAGDPLNRVDANGLMWSCWSIGGSIFGQSWGTTDCTWLPEPGDHPVRPDPPLAGGGSGGGDGPPPGPGGPGGPPDCHVTGTCPSDPPPMVCPGDPGCPPQPPQDPVEPEKNKEKKDRKPVQKVGASGDWLGHMAGCVGNLDPLASFGAWGVGALTVAGAPIPKALVGYPTALGSSPYTSIPSIVQHETGLNIGLRTAGRVSSYMFIGYGVWMFSAEVYCAATY